MTLFRTAFFLFFMAFFSIPNLAFAEDLQVEVMSLEGTATVMTADGSSRKLAEGDLLSVDDTVEVAQGSSLDLAYDKDWNNVTHIEENSKIRIQSLYPTSLRMEQGSILAKLKALPQESTFEVQTPTAVATVRGSEYQTTCESGGVNTQVLNFSDSEVYVFGQDEQGGISETPTVVRNNEKTQIPGRGRPILPPKKMSPQEFERGRQFTQKLERRVADNIARGRVGKLRDIGQIKQMYKENLGKFQGPNGPLVSKEAGAGKDKRMANAFERQKKITGAMRGPGEKPSGEMFGRPEQKQPMPEGVRPADKMRQPDQQAPRPKGQDKPKKKEGARQGPPPPPKR